MPTGDTRLLERWIQARDAEAFKAVCEQYAGLTYRASYRILRDATEAEDVAQECFEGLAALKRAPTGHLGAWLHQVATYRALNRRRGNQRRAVRERAYTELSPTRAEITWDDIYEHVDAAIADLPQKLRTAVVAHFLENQTHEAIALREGVSRAAVTQRIQRGIGKIRATLERRGVRVGTPALGALLTANLSEALPFPATLHTTIGKIALSGAAMPAIGSAVIPGGIMTLKSAAITSAIAAAAIICTAYSYNALVPAGDVAAPTPPSADEWKPAPLSRDATAQPAVAETGVVPASADTGAVSGRVYEAASGKGIANVQIMALRDKAKEASSTARAVTASDGSYVISGLAESHFKLKIETPVGYQPPVEPGARVVEAKPEVLLGGCDFALLFEVPLSGIVFDRADNPVPGAEVHIRSETFGNPVGARQTVVSDAAGGFAFHNLVPSGTLSIQASTPAACSALETVDLLDPGVEDLVLRIEAPASMEGHVVDPEGRPVAGVKLRLEHLASDRSWFISTPPTTDAQGRFSMAPLAPGEYKIRLRRDSKLAGIHGGKSEKGAVVALAVGEQKRGLELVYDRIYSISGRVVSASGEVVAPVQLMAQARSLGGASALSDASGAFTIEDLPDGEYNVEVYREGTRLADPIEDVAAGTQDLLVTIADVSNITGRVTSSATGKPITQFEVAIADEGTEADAYSAMQGFVPRDDENGEFSMQTSKSGTAVISVRAEGYYPASQKIVVPAQGGIDGIQLALQESPSLSGVVVDESNTPVPRTAIFIGNDYPLNREQPATTTGATGEFTLGVMPKGSFQVTAIADGYTTESVALPGPPERSAPVRIVLKSGGTLEGTVEFADGLMFDAAAVVAESVDEASHRKEVEVAEDGSYRIEALREGAYLVRIGVAHGETSYRALLRNAEIINGNTTRLDIAMPGGTSTIEGRIHDGRAGIKRGIVNLQLTTQSGEQEELAALADQSGIYRIDGVPAGTLEGTATITTSDGAITLEHGPVEVRAEKALRLDFVE